MAFKSARVNFYSEKYGTVVTRQIAKSQIKMEPIAELELWDPYAGEYVTDAGDSVRVSQQPKWKTSPAAAVQTRQFAHSWLPISRIISNPSRRKNMAHSSLQDSLDPVPDLEQQFIQGIHDRWLYWRYAANKSIRTAQDDALAAVLDVALRGASKRDSSVTPLDVTQAYDLVKNFFAERANIRMKLPFKNFDEFRKRYIEDTVLPDIVERLQKVESRIFEILEPQVRLEVMVKDLFSAGRDVEFSERGVKISVNNEVIPLGNLSSGERQLLVILLECLGSRRSTVLIDEPELSMHVAWQNRLIQCIRTINSRSQLVVATHSPEIMAELEDRCIIEL